jgi:FtsP/CotA-like multicopper oxidase with cupredoxin domain
MLNRRDFLKAICLGSGAAVFWRGNTLYARTGDSRIASPLAQIPGGTLDPLAVPQYAAPLLIPPAMPRAGWALTWGGKLADYYEIAVRQFQQQILPPPLPPTTVWGYGPAARLGKGPQIFNAPSLTIEAKWNTPVRIKWSNELVDAAGNFLPHLLPVDPTLHWANPPGGVAGRDTRPTFTSTPGPYTGPVPIVTHVHGSVNVGDESDGYAEAWYLPDARNVPAGYATRGTWYNFFRQKATLRRYVTPFRLTWERGSAVFQYPNTHRASTMWYHDHTLGMTRLNVYAGPAGFFIVRGGPDDKVRDSRTGKNAIMPGPAPDRDDLPGKRYYEISVAVQDRSFNSDGSLFYPDSRAFFDGVGGPYIPQTDVSPIWNPEFFGNFIMVNGNTWPFLNVEQRRYRFRFLNGCNSRFLILDFSSIAGVRVWQIGNEGGFLAAPVNMTALNGGRLLLAPAERADVIVDFTNVPVGNHELLNIGPDEPYSGGAPGVDFVAADPATTGKVMQFRVGLALSYDRTTPPEYLQLSAISAPSTANAPRRRLALVEEMSTFFADAPSEALLGTVQGDPAADPKPYTALMWSDPVTENPECSAVEIWEFYNTTGDAHPMHIHEVLFQVLDRQQIFVQAGMEMEGGSVQVVPGSTPTPPEPWEVGFKDTVIAYPGQVTRVAALFEQAGQFVWHCHIVEHEDNEMMRPYRIGPPQPQQPGDGQMDMANQMSELDELDVDPQNNVDDGSMPQIYMPTIRND